MKGDEGQKARKIQGKMRDRRSLIADVGRTLPSQNMRKGVDPI